VLVVNKLALVILGPNKNSVMRSMIQAKCPSCFYELSQGILFISIHHVSNSSVLDNMTQVHNRQLQEHREISGGCIDKRY
jgi:hypothetical protein